MGSFARLLCRKAGASVAPPVWEQFNFNGFGPSSIFRSLATISSITSSSGTKTVDSEIAKRLSPSGNHQRKVAVFWDLDNKPPKRVSPFEAATRLKEMAAEFGEVVDLIAYANHHAFAHVPSWVHEERKQRKVLDLLEATGEVKPEQPYVCGVCGAKKKTHVQLTNHFKMLHEREQRKRINRLDSLKSKKKQKERFRANNWEKMAKYKDAARSIIIPSVGYGLMQEIRRAGVYVKTVKDTPQAADIALKDHMVRSIKRGVKCLCLVSDDTDFKPELKMARTQNLHIVVVGDLRILDAYADTYFSWAEVASGRAEQKARVVNGQLLMREIGDVLGSELGVNDDGKPNRLSEVESEEFPVEADTDSEFGSDSDDDGDEEVNVEKRWRPVDRYVDVEYDKNFDSFSDDTSESDSEELERGSNVQMPPKLHGCLTNSKFVINNTVQTRLRSFTTKCEVSYSGQSYSKCPSNTEKGAIDVESTAQKPERLHYFFTMLESANKGHSLTDATNGQSTIEAGEEGDTQHFKRVPDILKSPMSKKGGDQTAKNDIKEIKEIHSQQLKDENAFEVSASEMVGKSLDSSRTQQTLTSGHEVESSKQKKRPRIRKSVPGKSRVIKVVNVGPRPFYMSGFASKSQADCDAVNKYYAKFWKDESEVYRGRQNRKRKI